MPQDLFPPSSSTAGLTDAELRASAVTVTGSGGTLSVDDGGGSLTVDASSLPLPTGASTAAKQPALGTAGTASADVITVQGIASMTALKVDGSAVTQPVSFSGDVTVVGKAAHNSAASGNPVLVAGIYEAAGAGLDDGDACALRVTSSGALTTHVINTVTVSGEILIQDAVTEDEASGGGESLVLAGAIRRDTATSGAGTDGDYATLSTDSTGRLWVHVGLIDQFPAAAALADGASNPTTVPVGANASLWNGSTWDRAQGKEVGTLLSAANYASSQFTSMQTSRTARGVIIFINVVSGPGVIGSNSLTFEMRVRDPITNANAQEWVKATTAITATTATTYFFEILEGISASIVAGAAPSQRFAASLPRFWDVVIIHGAGGTWNYSVTYQLIP